VHRSELFLGLCFGSGPAYDHFFSTLLSALNNLLKRAQGMGIITTNRVADLMDEETTA
jgi:hypothetical protein